MSTPHSVPSSCTLYQPVLIASTSDMKYNGFGVSFKVLTKHVGLYVRMYSIPTHTYCTNILHRTVYPSIHRTVYPLTHRTVYPLTHTYQCVNCRSVCLLIFFRDVEVFHCLNDVYSQLLDCDPQYRKVLIPHIQYIYTYAMFKCIVYVQCVQYTWICTYE